MGERAREGVVRKCAQRTHSAFRAVAGGGSVRPSPGYMCRMRTHVPPNLSSMVTVTRDHL